MNVIDAIVDAKLFRSHFRDLETWRAWLVVLRALFALPMDRGERAVYRKLTGRRRVPSKPATEAWFVVGRRGGKSFITAVIAVFLACFEDWTPYLAPGERGTVMVIATDRRQARVVFRYITALIEGVPMLARMMERRTSQEIDLNNRVTIEVHTASFRSVRGYTVLAALCDEIAFWRTDDSANPDRAILDALRPAMATVPGALLIGLGTPYRRAGALYEAHRDHFGKAGDVLVVQADTRTMNPTVPKRVIERAYERDPASAAAEYGAEFRTDIEGFLSRDAIDAVVVPGRRELPPLEGVRYVAFCDPSGGSRDSMTLAIAHHNAERRVVIDAVRERRPPFSPDAVVSEFADLLKRYRVEKVHGDRYGGEWPRERFREHGIEYVTADKTKSDLYLALLPEVNAGKVEILDVDRLVAQLASLERRTARGGKDSVDHPPMAHDDMANAVAGVVALTSRRGRPVELWGGPRAAHSALDAGFRPLNEPLGSWAPRP